MKLNILIKIALAIVIVSCGTTEEFSPEFEQPSTGTISALKNGEFWENPMAIGRSSLDTAPLSLSIVASKNNEYTTVLELFSFIALKVNFDRQKIGRYGECETESSKRRKCNLTSSSFGTLIGGDAVGISYETDTTAADNFIQITEYDIINEEIKGIFNVILVLTDKRNSDKNPPQIIKFTNGEFTTKVKKEWFE